MSRQLQIAQRIQRLKKELGTAQLIAVSKYCADQDILYAYQAGQRDFAENKVQDLQRKQALYQNLKDIRWHFIGNLQSNKVKTLLDIPQLYAIHSISSLKLLNIIIKNIDVQSPIQFFFQVNTSDEAEKGGFKNADELLQAYQLLKENQLGHLLLGLMTIGKIRTEHFKEEALKSFTCCRNLGLELQRRADLSQLSYSMGMSADYFIALEVGTDWVRIGSQIFANS